MTYYGTHQWAIDDQGALTPLTEEVRVYGEERNGEGWVVMVGGRVWYTSEQDETAGGQTE